jgi:hypothetical protein
LEQIIWFTSFEAKRIAESKRLHMLQDRIAQHMVGRFRLPRQDECLASDALAESNPENAAEKRTGAIQAGISALADY